ncbi:ATP-binding protein [Rhizobium leguminosarum]|uniref:ATP-binding protein n=1 Tax=Rhizobium leguminosarum TaxID=384 RepID=UPI00391F758F
MIGEATLADAILDRIVHNSHRITLEGDSMRKRKTPAFLTGGEITEINHPNINKATGIRSLSKRT